MLESLLLEIQQINLKYDLTEEQLIFLTEIELRARVYKGYLLNTLDKNIILYNYIQLLKELDAYLNLEMFITNSRLLKLYSFSKEDIDYNWITLIHEIRDQLWLARINH